MHNPGPTVVDIPTVRDGRSPLVLTERSEHLDRLEQMLAASVSHLVVLRAGLGKKQGQALAQRLAAIPRDEPRALLATGRHIGEGFDDARLDTLMLTLPVSWRGTIAQYAGRLHRLCEGKREVRIYDYADLEVPMLARMFDRRCRGYEALGYTIVLPASAVPGWPQDVPLSADPAWKRDYAGSVRRLTADGMDAPLADLFAHTVAPFAPDAEGADRARSATEAFLYRRLQTLPQTRGRFRLNAVLSIAFDGLGQMEVDLLCDDGPGTRRPASCRPGRPSPRPSQGPAAAGKRLPRTALSCTRRGPGSGPGARHHSQGAGAPARGPLEVFAVSRLTTRPAASKARFVTQCGRRPRFVFAG